MSGASGLDELIARASADTVQRNRRPRRAQRPRRVRARRGTLRDDGGGPVFVDTRFDLASITKVFVATVALVLVARGTLTLDGPLAPLVAEWRGGAHAPITLRQILAHSAGFRSGADYRTLLDENVERFAVSAALVAAPGERVVYSDLGFIALGVVLARAAGRPLRALVEQELRGFGARRTTFATAVREAVRATERDDWPASCTVPCTTRRRIWRAG